jgi:lactate 2-monooxygenase
VKKIFTVQSQRQSKIIFDGLSGIKPKIPVRLDQLEEAAQKCIPKENFAYISGGASRETGMRKERNLFEKWFIVPRILKDLSDLSTEINIFGQKHNYPFMLAPVGALDMANSSSEKAVGRAAAAEDINMVFSTQASTPMEDVAAGMGDSKRWYQLYWSKFQEFNLSLIRRAEASGCSALVITVDTQVLGWRTRDTVEAYSPIAHLSGVAQYISDPVFQKLLDDYIKEDHQGPKPKVNLKLLLYVMELAHKYPGSFFKNLTTLRPIKALSFLSELAGNPTLSWEDIVALRKHTKLPIILKGILSPEDAKLAIKHGIDGIILSTHGGRQLSSSVPSLEMLPDIAEVVQGKIPIFLDSGVRGGDDIFKALALGATAVFIGRPYAYALAIAGEAGVRELIQNLKAEFDTTMYLSGCTSIKDITRDKLRRID